MAEAKPIKPRERESIIRALQAGVVPSVGLRHIQVGRAGEVREMVRDIEHIADGGATFRLIVGEYGAGKTFFLNLTRLIAAEKKLVVLQADLAPDRRLHATGGQARNLYAELTRNLATRSKPEGGALRSIVERFISDAVKTARDSQRDPAAYIEEKLSPLTEQVSGFDFVDVINAYYRGFEAGDEALQAAALRWLRGEFSTKSEAKKALGVRSIIDDADVYGYLKLLAQFVRLAGYDGLLVVLDEMVNLHRLNNAQARRSNYEQLLRMLNDVLQGSSGHIGFLLSGTPEFLMDTRRGLYSYDALHSRLAVNPVRQKGLVDLSGPIIGLQNLAPEDLYVLLKNIRHVYAGGDEKQYLLPDKALQGFMDHCNKKIGAAYFQTPRNTVKAFVHLLALLDQNPGTDWKKILGQVSVESDGAEESAPFDEDGVIEAATAKSDDELASFRL